MKIYIENYSGSAADMYVDGATFTIPVGKHELTLDENSQMNGQSTVMWDLNGGMITDFMDDGDILVADAWNNAVFHSIEPASNENTLVPKEVFFEGFVLGGVIAATMMMFVMLKKVLMQGPTYD